MSKLNVSMVKPLLCFDIKDYNFFRKKVNEPNSFNDFIRCVIKDNNIKLLEAVSIINDLYAEMVQQYLNNL